MAATTAETRRAEERALDRDERALADQARYPALGRLEDRALADLVVRLRERRDRARGIARRQRREMRGKAAPAGATAATGDAGTLEKAKFLDAALRRAQDEVRRRKA